MTVRLSKPLSEQTVTDYFGLTLKQYSNLPQYVQDSMVSALRDVKALRRKLDVAEGVKPTEDSWGMEGVVVDTYSGDYVFPFKQLRAGATPGPKRGDVTLQFPLADGRMHRVSMSWRSERPGEVEINGGLRGIAIKPRASNCFTMQVDND